MTVTLATAGVRETSPSLVRTFSVPGREVTCHVALVEMRTHTLMSCTCGAPNERGRLVPDCRHARKVEGLLEAERERSRRDRLASTVPCPRCKGEGVVVDANGSRWGCGCVDGRVSAA